jgi:hypothetical protein
METDWEVLRNLTGHGRSKTALNGPIKAVFHSGEGAGVPGRARQSQVLNGQAAPSAAQVLGDEPAMTKMRLVFAAQQTSIFDKFPGNLLLDLPFLDQTQKLFLVNFPVTFVFLELIKDVLCRGESGKMDVIDPKDALEEILEVVAFAESCKLRHVVQPHIHHALHASLLQPCEKILGLFVGETYCANSHGPPVG